MNAAELHLQTAGHNRARVAEDVVRALFTDAGWTVSRTSDRQPAAPGMVVRRGDTSYVVEVKSAPEGRSDRLVPLWAQAHLQAAHAVRGKSTPLAVVAAPHVPRRAAEQVLAFAARYAPGAGAGVIDFAGLRMFRGPHLDELDAEHSLGRSRRRSAASEPATLFSDLNQWMLKVLLAPELPEALLAAPRGRYRNATELARAAGVSVMSASRLVRQLEHGGFLHESKPDLQLVRREELFRQWQMSGGRRIREAPFRFVPRGDAPAELERVVREGEGCLALFAAAEALNLGFVHGVPPHVYVRRLHAGTPSPNLVRAERNEVPDLIVREASTPHSIFRGAIRTAPVPVCDVLQVWLDVSWHPSRGQEQAEHIRRTVLEPLIDGEGQRK